MMNIIKFSDENYKKFIALKNSGITVNNHQYGNKTIYEITIKDSPNADSFIETSFRNVNDILVAFRDILYSNRFIVMAA